MTAALSQSDRTNLKAASPAGIVKHLERVERHLEHGRWLGTRNVYRQDPISRIEADSDDPSLRRPLQLADYVAASSPLHLWDGWDYLGLSLHAHVRGSVDHATHLAYYAELRAAMALLASQGIGVFKDRHCAIDRDGNVSCLSQRRTHVATWLYLENWADGPDAPSLLGRMFRLHSYSITDWLDEFPPGGAWNPLGTDLLLGMGLDLRRLSDDHDARNEASYRPTAIISPQIKGPRDDIDYLVEILRLLEPGGSPGDFPTLDMYLFRRIIERAFEAGQGRSPGQEPDLFHTAVDTMISKFLAPSLRQSSIQQFLTREARPEDPRVLAESESREDHSHKNYHLQVISRASLLLRVATGAVREVYHSADLNLDSVRFWWQKAGTTLGLWHSPPPTIDTSELWQDVAAALDEIVTYELNADTSRRSIVTTYAHPLLDATSMTRFALMGLAS